MSSHFSQVYNRATGPFIFNTENIWDGFHIANKQLSQQTIYEKIPEKVEVCNLSPTTLHLTAHRGFSFLFHQEKNQTLMMKRCGKRWSYCATVTSSVSCYELKTHNILCFAISSFVACFPKNSWCTWRQSEFRARRDSVRRFKENPSFQCLYREVIKNYFKIPIYKNLALDVCVWAVWHVA